MGIKITTAIGGNGNYYIRVTHQHICGCCKNHNTTYATETQIPTTSNEKEAAEKLRQLAQSLDNAFGRRQENEINT